MAFKLEQLIEHQSSSIKLVLPSFQHPSALFKSHSTGLLHKSYLAQQQNQGFKHSVPTALITLLFKFTFIKKYEEMLRL